MEDSIRRMRFDPEVEEGVLVNPNHDCTFRDTIHGRTFEVAPLERIQTSKKMANMMYARAQRKWNDQKAQARAERQMWAKMSSSSDLSVRDKAKEYADKDGNTNTTPFPKPGLVWPSDSGEGERMYKDGIDKAKAEGMKTPAEKPIELPKEVTTSKGDIDMTELVLQVPNEDWSPEEKLDYIKKYSQFTGEATSHLMKGKPTLLNKKIANTYEFMKAFWKEKDIGFVEK